MQCTGIFPWRLEPWRPSDQRLPSFDLQRFADGEKTEEPTAKKRSEAAKKGQVARSQELNAAYVLLIP